MKTGIPEFNMWHLPGLFRRGLLKSNIFSILVFMLFSTVTVQAQVKFGILGGVNLQNIDGHDQDGCQYLNGFATGFHAGANIKIILGPNIAIQSGLQYTLKGTRTNDVFGHSLEMKSAEEPLYSTTYKLHYVEIQVDFLSMRRYRNGNFLLGFGAYIAYALDGKAIYEVGPNRDEHEVKFEKSVTLWETQFYPYFRHVDAGAGILAGYEFGSGVFFRLDIRQGIVKINSEIEDDDGVTLAKRNFGISVSTGFMF